MNNSNYTIDSPERLAALRGSGLLEPAVEPMLDRLTKLATVALGTPVALISLVDEDRQFFKSQCGLPDEVATQRETPLSHSFCQHVVESGEPLLIADARLSDLVKDNLAVRDLGVIAYAGVPVLNSEGAVLGSFCVIDTKPRQWTTDDVELLFSLSAQVSSYVQLQGQSKKLSADLMSQKAVEADRRQMLRLNVHDLRTPLSAMMLAMDVVKLLGPLNDEQEEYLTLCKRNGQTLLNLVNNLLDIGNIEERGKAALNCTPTRPTDLAKGAIEQTQSLAMEKMLNLVSSVPNSLPDVSVDADKVTRVLVNLIANAIKFTNERGNVRVSAASEPGAIKFTVKDSGIGIEKLTNVFDEGVRADTGAATEFSTGLGLTFCKRIVEVHGGQIWFDSQVDVGTSFHFTLPINSD